MRSIFKVTGLWLGLGAGELGGWVLLGPMGLVVLPSAPGADRPSKEASGDAARAAKNHFATLPMKQAQVGVVHFPLALRLGKMSSGSEIAFSFISIDFHFYKLLHFYKL